MVLNHKDRHVIDNWTNINIYSIYRAGEVSILRTPSMQRAGYPTYSVGGGGTICSGSRPADGYHTYPRIITECLSTRSKLIKMYVRAIYS